MDYQEKEELLKKTEAYKTILYNDDCLEIMRNIEDNSINCIITDPPYKYLKNQEFDRDFDEKSFFNECKRILKKDGFIILFGRGTSFYRWNVELVNLGFNFKEEIIWNKRQLSSPFNHIQRIHETISIHTISGKLNTVKNPYKEKIKYDLENVIRDIKRLNVILNNPKELAEVQHYIETKNYNNLTKIKRKVKFGVCLQDSFNRSRCACSMKQIVEGCKLKSIIECYQNNKTRVHPTQKPVELLEKLIKLSSKEEYLILDPFMGSGSTGVACVNTNRNFIGIELDKKYFKIAKERIEESKRSFFVGAK